MVEARTKPLFRGRANLTVRVQPDGSLGIEVQVSRKGRGILREALQQLIHDLDTADEDDLAVMAAKMN